MKIISGKYIEESNWQKWVKFKYPHGNKLSVVFLRRLAALARDLKIEMASTLGYRPKEETQRLYDADLKAHGGKPSGKVATPGYSWHEHGLAVDLTGAFWENLSNHAWVTKSRLNQSLNEYGLMVPLNKIDSPNTVEWWHIQPIETNGIPAEKKSAFLDTDDEIYGTEVKPMGDIAKLQTAAKAIQLYSGNVDDMNGPLTKKAALELYGLIQRVMALPDVYKLKSENDQLKAALHEIKMKTINY